MISFQRFELENGLRVIHYYDPNSTLCVLNTLYNVGARDEQPHKTGFAHLFEHLMFGGSKNIPNFDGELQLAGGTNNAFTSNDITNYYTTVPLENTETAFWLESDRMMQLDFSEKSLEVQKNVVIEEFKQRYLNQPYGDVWHKIRAVAYIRHPYGWPTIGKEIKHVEEATMEYVKEFFKRFYHPSNAILCVAGGLSLEKTKELLDKWYAGIPAGPINQNQYPMEPYQRKKNHIEHHADVPKDKLMMSFKMCGKNDDAYYPTDVLSDLLGYTDSSYLAAELVKKEQVFTSINAFVLGSIDAGLLTISATPANGVSLEEAEKRIWEKIATFKEECITEHNMKRVVNKIKTGLAFNDLSVLEIAMNLSFFENFGDINGINEELNKYNKVSIEEVKALANSVLQESQCTTLYYKSNQK